MMPWKFCDNISNGSGVIVVTDRQTNTQTDITENNTTLATWVVIIPEVAVDAVCWSGFRKGEQTNIAGLQYDKTYVTRTVAAATATTVAETALSTLQIAFYSTLTRAVLNKYAIKWIYSTPCVPTVTIASFRCIRNVVYHGAVQD